MHYFEVLILTINKFNEINKSLAQIKLIIKKVRRTEVILIKFYIIKNYFIWIDIKILILILVEIKKYIIFYSK